MMDTSYDYNAPQLSVGEQGHWAGPSPTKRWLPHPYQFTLSSQLAGYDGSDSGTMEDCFVQVDSYDQSAQTWTRPVQIDAAEAQFSTTGTEKVLGEPLQHEQGYEDYTAVCSDESSYHLQHMCIDAPSPPLSDESGSPSSMNSLDSIGSGTPTGLRDASGSVYSNESWVAPAVDIQVIGGQPQSQDLPTCIQNQHTTSYYAAHQPIPPQQQSNYTSLFQHLTFMNHVEARGYGKSKSKPASGSAPSTSQIQPCLSTATTPLTSRHRKRAAPPLSLSALPVRLPHHPTPFGSAIAPEGQANTNSAVPQALTHPLSHTQPPVQAQEPPYQPYTMLSTKTVKGRHLLPAIPSPPSAIVLSKASAATSSTSSPPSVIPLPGTTHPASTAPSDVASAGNKRNSSVIPMKREASEAPEESLSRSRPVSRRGSAASASEACSALVAESKGTSNESVTIKIPPPSRRGSGIASSSSAAAQKPHLVYPHPPVVLDFAMGSSKGSTSGGEGVMSGVGGGTLMTLPGSNTVTRNVKEPRRPSLACTFCRERKIACGRPPTDSEDQTCNQCARRGFLCEYTNDPKRRTKGLRKKRGTSTGTESSEPSTPAA
ncbi:hypothetical protein CVT24_000121 [Panaeolus cyanescens]|uniref:Zn(2)-C6 fungal-type domain-containing protein n=1 Tax=Panaeolus cyanescens TaxID=181874 RepID=A0A409W7K8_9AGAR|nr:hypothetical protein CVT24_000121 [Panaeolus cyanescens]